MATLTQISNIFNLMVQEPNSRLLYYHWGYRYDINREIGNNFDQKNSKGRQYPALQMDVPDNYKDLKEPSYYPIQQDVKITLYFDKLQDYDNAGKADTRNTIEQVEYLRGIAKDFMSNLVEVFAFYGDSFFKTFPTYTPRTNLHNPKLITLQVDFTITTQTVCIDDANKIDLNNLPATISEVDIENWKA